jgi:hypothetical protein
MLLQGGREPQQSTQNKAKTLQGSFASHHLQIGTTSSAQSSLPFDSGTYIWKTKQWEEHIPTIMPLLVHVH